MEPPHKRRRNRGGRIRGRGQIDRGRGRSRNPDRGRGRETGRAHYPSIEDQLLKIEHRLTYVKESAWHLEQVLAEIDDNLDAVFRSVRAPGKQPEQKGEATDIENYNPELELERDIEEGVDNAQLRTGDYREDEIDWDDGDEESQHVHCEHDHGYWSEENIEDSGGEQEHFEIEQPALEEEESDEDGDAYDPKAPFILDEHKIAFHEPSYDGHPPFSYHSHNDSYVSASIPPPNALQKQHYSPRRTNESNTLEQPNYSPTPPNESARKQAYLSPPPQLIYSLAPQRASSPEKMIADFEVGMDEAGNSFQPKDDMGIEEKEDFDEGALAGDEYSPTKPGFVSVPGQQDL